MYWKPFHPAARHYHLRLNRKRAPRCQVYQLFHQVRMHRRRAAERRRIRHRVHRYQPYADVQPRRQNGGPLQYRFGQRPFGVGHDDFQFAFARSRCERSRIDVQPALSPHLCLRVQRVAGAT